MTETGGLSTDDVLLEAADKMAKAITHTQGEFSAVRAAEVAAEAILKGTHSGVDGVYTDDPLVNPSATKFDEVTYIDVLNRGLKVMDSTAITFCMDNKLPIVVFDLMRPGNIRRALQGEAIGTLVR